MQNVLKQGVRGLMSAGLAVVLAMSAGEVLAQGKSDQAPGRIKNQNLGHHSASDGVKALIKSNRQIFYSGDPLLISLKFPRGAELVASGEVDAHLLIFKPNAETIALPVSDIASEQDHKLFDIRVDPEYLPAGVYQFGVVLTVEGGDPLNLDDWYNGLRGLIAMRGLTVSDGPTEVDLDGDGEVDCDEDDDGFVDEGSTCEADIPDDDDGSDDDSSGDDASDDDASDDDASDDDASDDDASGDEGDEGDGESTDGEDELPPNDA